MSSKCEFTGRVVAVGNTEKLGREDKPFYKRIIVVDDAEIGAKYPNPVPFEATGDKCKYLDQYKAGDEVYIEFFPNGRGWDNPKTKKRQWFSSNRIGFIKLASEVDNGDSGEGDPLDGGDPIDDGGDNEMPF